MAPSRAPVRVLQDSYGRWWYSPPSGSGQQATVSAGPFADRWQAAGSARAEHPGHPVMCDGVTIGASKPQLLADPAIGEARAEAEARREDRRRTLARQVRVTRSEIAPVAAPAALTEPRGYGQGARFEEQHGPDAGRLGEGIRPSAGVDEDPLSTAQTARAAMRDALRRAQGE